MSKKTFIISMLLVVVITLAIIGLYNTYAIYTSFDESQNHFSLNNDTQQITLAAGESKSIVYQIKNANNGTVKYGVGYSGSNIIVKYYEDTYD